MPSHMHSNATSLSRRAATEGSPTENIRLVSPWKPSLMTVMSMFRTSPFFRTRSPGMPWQTWWFTDVQMDLGKGR